MIIKSLEGIELNNIHGEKEGEEYVRMSRNQISFVKKRESLSLSFFSLFLLILVIDEL